MGQIAKLQSPVFRMVFHGFRGKGSHFVRLCLCPLPGKANSNFLQEEMRVTACSNPVPCLFLLHLTVILNHAVNLEDGGGSSDIRPAMRSWVFQQVFMECRLPNSVCLVCFRVLLRLPHGTRHLHYKCIKICSLPQVAPGPVSAITPN